VILADTSAWVEYDRKTGSPAHVRLRELVHDEGPLSVTEPVIMEVLAGAKDDAREADLRRLLRRFALLPFEAPTDFDGAIHVYRKCRRSGITPRGLLDCVIATVALRHGATLLAHDVDLARIAAVLGLQLDDASLLEA
jgi:predicted nucleic acid-binding protein